MAQTAPLVNWGASYSALSLEPTQTSGRFATSGDGEETPMATEQVYSGRSSITMTSTLRRRHNRFGTMMSKNSSAAEKLGYSLKRYVPIDVLSEVASKVSANVDGAGTETTSSKAFLEMLMKDEQADLIQMEVEHLKEAGLNLDEITRYVYEHLHDQELPNFMANLRLDQDGGLDRVNLLWYNQRIFWFVLLVAFVVMNVQYLVCSNWVVFESFTTHILKTDKEGIPVQVDLNFEERLQQSGKHAGEELSDIYSHIKDPDKRQIILQLAGAVGTIEVLWVLVKLIQCLDQMRVFMFDKSEYRQWAWGTKFFSQSLPVLSTFSLLKCVAFVHPSLIATQYFDMLQQRYILPDTVCGTVLVTVYFALSRVVIAVLAVGAFAMKLLAVGLKLVDSKYGLLACFMQSALLMNQAIGCVLFDTLLQDRIFLFIFGGGDTDFREDELALKNVYRCRLSKQIWEYFWIKGEKCQSWKAVVLLATLDHFDLQMLLIDDPPETVTNTPVKNTASLDARPGGDSH